MDIQVEKLELIKMLAETENPAIIKSIRKIFKKEQKDWWEDLSKEQQNEINESLEDYEKGNYSSFEEFIEPHL